MKRVDFGHCYAQWNADEIEIGNAYFARRWRITNGLLYAASFYERTAQMEWIASPAEQSAPSPAEPLSQEPRTLDFASEQGTGFPTEAPSLRLILTATGKAAVLVYRFQVFAEARGVTCQLTTQRMSQADPVVRQAASVSAAPTGIELSQQEHTEREARADALELFTPAPRHLRLTQVTLHDQTDSHNALVFENEWLLHPSEAVLSLQGNVFRLEDTLTQSGLLFLKLAPLPEMRPVPNPVDLEVRSGKTLAFLGHGDAAGADGYSWVVLAYSGGRTGWISALQTYQRQLRRYVPGRDARFLSNTWGDRGQDGRLSEDFARQEIEAGRRLGVDVVQLDDGWQAGRTANSVEKGGVWEGFWAQNAQFWDCHPARFPNGLASLVTEAAQGEMEIGLWFAPDSTQDFGNWERDAAQILALHNSLGVNHFKIDGVKVRSKVSEANLFRFFDRVLRHSEGRIVFDLDITAETRPGPFGLPQIGPLFVENRYTDWYRYWPHHTLRNLWQLAHYIDPARLRMEFLNNARHSDLYGDDPLAPATYDAEYLFATVMFSCPLGWFEVSQLPPRYFTHVAPLVRVWKQHRDAVFAGTIIPIGNVPDGTSWTGFGSVTAGGTGGYVLLFREHNHTPACQLEASFLTQQSYQCEILAGAGTVSIAQGVITAHLPQAQSFVFAKLHQQGTRDIKQ